VEKIMNKIESIRIVHHTDTCPDTSWLGMYTDKAEKGVIYRGTGEFLKCKRFTGELDLDDIYAGSTREYKFFKPYAGGEKVDSRHYKKNGMQDYKRMEGLNNGDWCFIGIAVEAEVSYDIGHGSRRLERLSSSGIWGVESDCPENIKELEAEQMQDLKEHLTHMGTDVSDFDKIPVTRKDD
jgi:hypothetical protein